jgi:hypothetical protein
MSRFQRATRKQLKLRMALCGPTGAGKTRSALRIAKYLGQRIAVIDSENRSASKYVGCPDVPDFDVLELDSFAPKTYVDAIHDAEREGYDVIIVDGISQAWNGKDGALEMVDKAAKRSQTGNSFTAWRDITPLHNQFVDAMVRCKAHLIVTMRSKTEWVLEENERGKKVPRKIGMAPEQRNGVEFEFDVVGDLDTDHNLLITKTRCDALDGAMINKPGRDVAEMLSAWLEKGEAQQERPLAETAPTSSRGEDASTQTRAASPRTSSESPSSTTATGQPTTTTSPDQPHDIDYWLNGHNGVYARAVKAGAAEDVGVDEYGLQLPSLPKPTFSDAAKVHAGKAYDEVPAGFLREVIFAKPDFARQPPNVRLWTGYLVSRHEIGKLAKAIEDAAAEQALAAQAAEQAAV